MTRARAVTDGETVGPGAVGWNLAELLHEQGARLTVADIQPAKVERAVAGAANNQLSYAILAVYGLPLLSFGAWRILHHADRGAPIPSLIQQANSRSGR